MWSALTVLCALFRLFYVFYFDCFIAYALFQLLYLFCFDRFMCSAPTAVCTCFYCFKCPASTVLCALLHIFSSTECRVIYTNICFNLSEKWLIPMKHWLNLFFNKLSKFLYLQIWCFMDTCQNLHSRFFFITFSTSSSITSFLIMYFCDVTLGITSCRARLKHDDTCAETRFGLLAKRTTPFKLAGRSVQSTTGSRGVGITSSNGSNVGFTMFWDRVQEN